MTDSQLSIEVLASVRQLREEMTMLRNDIHENHSEAAATLQQHMEEEVLELAATKATVENISLLVGVLQQTANERFRIILDTSNQLKEVSDTLSCLNDKTTSIEGAFPNKDTKGHHDHHLELITKEQRWRSRLEKWKDDIGGWVVKITLVFIGLAIWEAFKANLR